MPPISLLDEQNLVHELNAVVRPTLKRCETVYALPVSEKVTLSCRLYLAKRSEACVVISHGFTESALKFEELAYYFLAQGFSVLLYDHRGHGFSTHEVGDASVVYVRRFDDYVHDLHRAADAARAMLPKGCRMLLFGHSMGGGIAARALELYPDDFCRCVLNAPMLAIQTGSTPPWAGKLSAAFFLALGLGKRRYFAQKPYAPGEPFEQSSCTSRARYEAYAMMREETPQLHTNAASYRWIWEGLRSHDRLFHRKMLARIHTPTLVFRAEWDSFVRPEAMDAFVRAVPCASLVDVKGVKHEIYRSPNDKLFPYLAQLFAFLQAEAASC